MEKLKIYDVYVRFIQEDGSFLYQSISDCYEVGYPIDDNGDDLERDSDNVYYKDSFGEYQELYR